ncbi:hypothetical protein P8452_71566 [Trifolium repens]|nr:hypothetical protein P8452_71566 [Trifolium repens]
MYANVEYHSLQVGEMRKRYKRGITLNTKLRNTLLGQDQAKILLAYLSTPHHEGPEVDRDVAQKDAKVLYKAGKKKLGTDEKTFVQIFSQRSGAHLDVVSSYYPNMYGHSLKKAVKNEASGNFGHALLTISECATYPPKYFAKIHYALHVHVIFESFEFGLILELPKVYWWRGKSPLAMKDAYRPGAF